MQDGPPFTRAGFLKLCAGAGAALLAAPALGGRTVPRAFSTYVESLRPTPGPHRRYTSMGSRSGLVPSELEIL